MDARALYTVATALVLGVMGYFGLFVYLFEWVPPVVLFPVIVYIGLQQRRRSLMESYGDMALLKGTPGRQLGFRRHIPPLLFLVALTILLAAMARPVTLA